MSALYTLFEVDNFVFKLDMSYAHDNFFLRVDEKYNRTTKLHD